MEKFLADESVDFRIVARLREEGYEIEAIVEMASGMTDEEVLHLAMEKSLILITEDKDFGELTFRLKKPNHGIILIRMNGIPIKTKLDKILYVLRDYLPLLKDKFAVVSGDKLRIKQQK